MQSQVASTENILEIIVVGDVYHKSITEQSSFLYSPTRLDQTFVSSSRFESGLSLNLMVLAVGEGSGLEDERALSAGDEWQVFWLWKSWRWEDEVDGKTSWLPPLNTWSKESEVCSTQPSEAGHPDSEVTFLPMISLLDSACFSEAILWSRWSVFFFFRLKENVTDSLPVLGTKSLGGTEKLDPSVVFLRTWTIPYTTAAKLLSFWSPVGLLIDNVLSCNCSFPRTKKLLFLFKKWDFVTWVLSDRHTCSSQEDLWLKRTVKVDLFLPRSSRNQCLETHFPDTLFIITRTIRAHRKNVMKETTWVGRQAWSNENNIEDEGSASLFEWHPFTSRVSCTNSSAWRNTTNKSLIMPISVKNSTRAW